MQQQQNYSNLDYHVSEIILIKTLANLNVLAVWSKQQYTH